MTNSGSDSLEVYMLLAIIGACSHGLDDRWMHLCALYLAGGVLYYTVPLLHVNFQGIYQCI